MLFVPGDLHLALAATPYLIKDVIAPQMIVRIACYTLQLFKKIEEAIKKSDLEKGW